MLIGAGLLARNAAAKGLKAKPWVKTSLAPGSQVVAEYLANSGLQKDLDKIGFNLVGFGCTTCIGNSGPLPAAISKTINDNGIIAAAVLSGNRNFEGRVIARRAGELPGLAAAGRGLRAGRHRDQGPHHRAARHGQGRQAGLPQGHLADARRRSRSSSRSIVTAKIFKKRYADVFKGDEHWRKVKAPEGQTYRLGRELDLCAEPALFRRHEEGAGPIADIKGARVLGLFGDKITTDHISPAGSIKADLAGRQVPVRAPGRAPPTSTSTARGAATMK